MMRRSRRIRRGRSRLRRLVGIGVGGEVVEVGVDQEVVVGAEVEEGDEEEDSKCENGWQGLGCGRNKS